MRSRKDRDVRELTNRERRIRKKKRHAPSYLDHNALSPVFHFLHHFPFSHGFLSREGGIHTASTGEVVAPKSSMDLLLARTALAVHNKCDLHELVHLNL